MAQEEDPISTLEGAPKRMAEFLMELYKVMRDQKMQQQQQAAMQANQEAMQKQQQAFMQEQNERLMDVMKQSGIPGTDANMDLAKSGLTRMERLAEDEVQTTAKLQGIDKEIAAIDQQQKDLLAPTVETEVPDPLKVDADLAELEKTQLNADKTFKADMEKLVDTPGMEPDKLYEGMEKLKMDKAALDKDLGQKREGLLKAKEGPKPKLTPGEKADQLQALHEKKSELIKSKGPLQEKMKGIETSKAGIMQGKGMEGMQMGGMKQGMGQAPKMSAGKGLGTDPIMFGGVDLSTARPGSTGETIGKGLKALKSGGKQVVEVAQKIGKHL